MIPTIVVEAMKISALSDEDDSIFEIDSHDYAEGIISILSWMVRIEYSLSPKEYIPRGKAPFPETNVNAITSGCV